MNDMSNLSSVTMSKPKYRQMSIPSTITTDSSLTNSSSLINRTTYTINPPQPKVSTANMTTMPEILEISEIESISSSNHMNEKSDIDLGLEEFQRQALKEHNAMRIMYNKTPLKLSESLSIYAQVKEIFFLRQNIIFLIIVLG